jgi:tripartite-type tricarboxylate transporter receptor subunit TctC
VVKSDLPAKTIKDFVAVARANPDKFNCATPPIGTTPQIQLEVLKIREKAARTGKRGLQGRRRSPFRPC